MTNHADSLNESEPAAIKSQAKTELAPLEVDGIKAVTVGTAIWAIIAIGFLLQREGLEATGRGNWIWISLCGVLLGLLGMRYTRRRAARIAKAKV